MRQTPLSRSTPLKRGPAPKRTGRLKPQSAKRRKVNKARWELAADHLDEPCRLKTPACTGWAEHFHELVGRAQGGSLVDQRNLVPACDRCNGWVEDNPDRAYVRGLKMPKREAKPGDRGLVPSPDNGLAIAWDNGLIGVWRDGGDAA